MAPPFTTELRGYVEAHKNLVRYCDRCMDRWFPDFETDVSGAGRADAVQSIPA